MEKFGCGQKSNRGDKCKCSHGAGRGNGLGQVASGSSSLQGRGRSVNGPGRGLRANDVTRPAEQGALDELVKHFT
jgi:hypothetical protein